MADDPSPSASLTNLYAHLQTLIKKWVYDKPEVDNKLSNKLDKAQTSYKGKNVIVDSSSGNIAFEDKNNHTHSQYLTEHQSLANYVLNSSLGSVAFSNDYDDLDNKPTIPTATSDLTNDSFGEMAYHSYLSEIAGSTDIIDILQADGYSLFSGDYDDLDNKPTIPTIPTNVSAFNNDSGYLTAHQDITGKEDKSNKVTSLSSSSTDTQYPSAKAVYDAIENTFNLDTLDCINENFTLLSLPQPIIFTYNEDSIDGMQATLLNRYDDGAYVDWGDGTPIETYEEGDILEHGYSDNVQEHTIIIYGKIKNGYITTSSFKDLTGITSITIPPTVQKIGHTTFNNCTGLTSINIPQTVVTMGLNNFMNCINLNTIILNWTELPPISYATLMTGSPSSISPTFSIPYGTTSLYESKGYPTEKLVERSE